MKPFNEVLDQVNANLSAVENELIQEFVAPEFPTIFIVGPPRSGTTLLLQGIINHLDLSYINNFVAKFWEAPALGCLLFKDLLKPGAKVQYTSDYGFTQYPHEPHEFGYFWKRFFHYEETHELSPASLAKIDSALLLKEVAAMEAIMEKPVIFKNPPALSLQIDFLNDTFKNAIFLYTKRDLLDNAKSLLKGRLEYMDDVETWFSTKPAEYGSLKNLPVAEQIVGQIDAIQRKIEKSLESIPSKKKLVVSYEAFCHDPAAVLQKVRNLLLANGYDSQIRDTGRIESFSKTAPGEAIEGITDQFISAIQKLKP